MASQHTARAASDAGGGASAPALLQQRHRPATQRAYACLLKNVWRWYGENRRQFPGVHIPGHARWKINYDVLQAQPDAFQKFLVEKCRVTKVDQRPRPMLGTMLTYMSALRWGIMQQEEYHLDSTFWASLKLFLAGVRKHQEHQRMLENR